ncbi:IS110 family transposase, partial [Bacillus pseudomycoides]|nr:IS110 family transposase [Bacillus pseudomycoides]
LSRLYSELDHELSLMRSRMLKVIQLTFSELEQIFTTKPDFFLNFVQLFPHSNFVPNLSITVMKKKIRKNTNINISISI